LGLGWLEAQILGRNSVLARKPLDWIDRFSEQLFNLELKELPATYDMRRHGFFISESPIHGKLKWGYESMHPHNQLKVSTILVGDTTLVDPNQPASPDSFFRRHQFEPRWFRYCPILYVNGNYCALEEWIKPRDFQNHSHRITVFDFQTGDDVTNKLVCSPNSFSEFKKMNLVIKD
ncbi:MAG: hypothetical protein JWQ71_880, partial [Pedosphaera sp.]|nr:hypothetical protein [Pedosphaera sp.]